MPDNASAAEIARLLQGAGRGTARRVAHISAALLGRPYVEKSLVGGPGTPERLVTRLDAFDCVTFVESVFALALSEEAGDFAPRLTALRYHEGRVRWQDRNHYMVQWVARNSRAGLVRPAGGAGLVWGDDVRELNVVKGLPPVRWRPRYLPVERVRDLGRVAQTGDLVCMMSEKPNLDVFHTGLLVEGSRLVLRHAGQTAGEVVDEPLDAFLRRSPTPGFLLARLAPVLAPGEHTRGSPVEVS